MAFMFEVWARFNTLDGSLGQLPGRLYDHREVGVVRVAFGPWLPRLVVDVFHPLGQRQLQRLTVVGEQVGKAGKAGRNPGPVEHVHVPLAQRGIALEPAAVQGPIGGLPMGLALVEVLLLGSTHGVGPGLVGFDRGKAM